jgi:hypothetical protein
MFVTAIGLAACSSPSSDEQGLDAAASRDASADDVPMQGKRDAAVGLDGSLPRDAASELDGSQTSDAGANLDGSLSSDAAILDPDASETTDAETPSGSDAGEDASAGTPKTWRTPVRISNTVDVDVYGLDLGFGETGGIAVAVWSSFATSASVKQSIWANVFTVGAGWGTPTRIDAVDQNAQRPKVALDGLGNAFVVWEQSDGLPTSDGPGARYNIWQNRYVKGTGWIGAGLLETLDGESYAVNMANAPRVAASANGAALAVWMQGANGNPSVWKAAFTPGVGWGEAELAESATSSVGPPNVAMDASGNSTVVWAQLTGTNFHAWASINGGSPTQLDTSVGHSPGSFAVAMVGGSAVVAWANGCSVWANRSSSGTWGSARELQPTASCASLTALEMTMDGAGVATALWYRSVGGSFGTFAATSDPTTGWSFTTLLRSSVNLCRRAVNQAGESLSAWMVGNTIRANTNFDELYVSDVIQAADGYDPHIGIAGTGHAVTAYILAEQPGVRNAVWASSYE